jgi:hypothetical protein
MLREEVVRGGVEPPTFRFSGVTDVQASDVAAAWTVAEVRRRSGSVAVVAVTFAVGSKLCEPPTRRQGRRFYSEPIPTHRNSH